MKNPFIANDGSIKIKSDFDKGYEEAKAGYYDKWYRYNRKDQGHEYDGGCK